LIQYLSRRAPSRTRKDSIASAAASMLPHPCQRIAGADLDQSVTCLGSTFDNSPDFFAHCAGFSGTFFGKKTTIDNFPYSYFSRIYLSFDLTNKFVAEVQHETSCVLARFFGDFHRPVDPFRPAQRNEKQ
jgi:hypothetical protein